MLKVSEIAYSTGQAAQTDFITAEVNLAQAQLQQRQYQVSWLTMRPALTSCSIETQAIHSTSIARCGWIGLDLRLQTAIDMAFHARQEILEAALTERNQNTALELARMEYTSRLSGWVQL